VDAGHGGDDPGVKGSTGLTEAEVSGLLAASLVEHLAGEGAEPFLLARSPESAPTSGRAAAANDQGGEVLISLHLGSDDDPGVAGASCYYFGRGGYVSPAGQRLAELMLEELTGSLGLESRGAHAKSLALLRETRMPAVHLEPCFITNPGEETRLRTDDFRRDLTAAVATALRRFFDGDVSRTSATPAQQAEEASQGDAERQGPDGP
jgi:N-acetylmuramoyl-L-alanine amidase